MNADCRRCDDANAYLADELSPRERADFQTHLAECAECRAAVDSSRRVLSRLRAVPEMETARDLAPLILARLREPVPALPLRAHWPRIAAIAAVLALCVGGAVLWQFQHAASAPSSPAVIAAGDSAGVARALDWFCQSQEADGSWDAEKWGGQARFEIALTGLSTLALLSGESPTPDRAAAVSRASRWLQEQQTGAGAFGPDFQGAPYNHSIATLALLHAYRHQPDAGLKRALDAALDALIARQTRDGGWGYAYTPLADRSITDWHFETLELASALGWSKVDAPLACAQAWLAVNPHPRTDAEEPADSPSALLARTQNSSSLDSTPLDFYRAYFLTAELLQKTDAPSRQRLAAVRRTVLLRQISAGQESGTWPPDDCWGRAGGRLYSTALAALSLREQ